MIDEIRIMYWNIEYSTQPKESEIPNEIFGHAVISIQYCRMWLWLYFPNYLDETLFKWEFESNHNHKEDDRQQQVFVNHHNSSGS